jgi:hypothetical protein
VRGAGEGGMEWASGTDKLKEICTTSLLCFLLLFFSCFHGRERDGQGLLREKRNVKG